MNIVYRAASITDFTCTVDLFLANMDLSVFTDSTDENILRAIATLFIAKDFQHANYICVASNDKQLCGVLLATVDVDTSQAPAFIFDATEWIEQSTARLQQSAEGRLVLKRMTPKDKPQSTVIERTMLAGCDADLLFFCSDANYRRQKIGSTLIQRFETHLALMGATKYKLESDNRCSYQYYDNNGFQRVTEEISHFNPSVEHYTYTKSLTI